MASQNVLEVISKGNIEMCETDEGDFPRKSSTGAVVFLNASTSSNHVLPVNKSNSQFSLETLPPEVPSSQLPGAVDHAINGGSVADCDSSSPHLLDTDGLHERICHLAELVKQEVQRAGGETINLQEHSYQEEMAVDSDELVGDRDRSKKSVCQDAEMLEKVQRGLAKMKRMDVKLNDLIKRERDVKRHRRLLEQQTEAMDSGRGGLICDALVPLDYEEGEDWRGSPVFQTQPHDLNSNSHALHTADGDQGEQSKQREKRLELKGAQNFIKRNIELAADAGSIVAMTEKEKQRLKELLGDSEEDEGDNDDNEDIPSATAKQEERESEVLPISGFSYNENDLTRLRDIDSQLQEFVPVLSVCSTPSQQLQCTGEATSKVEFHDGSERMRDIDSKLGVLAKQREAEDNNSNHDSSHGDKGIPHVSETSDSCHPSGKEIDMLVAQYKMEKGIVPSSTSFVK